ncbi:hypothetical protein FOXYS1_13251 [Fusarium oxysporum]|uniref:Uncharacterized protein n=1 Tax=Fusarium oxysporum TaxID=5507 RepID=A0A8H5ED44_FUSOX|nr:hypothetical protein FOXYS1_13251 [Fusarium oxysporum]
MRLSPPGRNTFPSLPTGNGMEAELPLRLGTGCDYSVSGDDSTAPAHHASLGARPETDPETSDQEPGHGMRVAAAKRNGPAGNEGLAPQTVRQTMFEEMRCFTIGQQELVQELRIESQEVDQADRRNSDRCKSK